MKTKRLTARQKLMILVSMIPQLKHCTVSFTPRQGWFINSDNNTYQRIGADYMEASMWLNEYRKL